MVRDGKIPEDWSRSWLVNVYKGKGDALECGSYRGIKLVEHAMKILERVIERRVRNVVKIDSMQLVLWPGKAQQMQFSLFASYRKNIWQGIKNFGWLLWIWRRPLTGFPGSVWWALRCLGVDEWIVSVIKAMYEDATTTVRVNGRESKAFSVRVGVHQGSVLSPLLFIIVLEPCLESLGKDYPWSCCMQMFWFWWQKQRVADGKVA